MIIFDVNSLQWTRKPQDFHAEDGKIRFGIYACSPEESSFTAVFSDMKITECAWKAHDGQAPEGIGKC